MLVGIDEVGRGPIAGPLVVCGASFPEGFPEEIRKELRDSKKLSPKKRNLLAQQMITNGIHFILSEASPFEIDDLGMAFCLKRCVNNIEEEFNITYPNQEVYSILDGSVNYLSGRGENRIKADDSVQECMAASIIAKEYRDNIMRALHEIHPEYHWDKNSGYGTKQHYEAVSIYGITKVHRKSFLKRVL